MMVIDPDDGSKMRATATAVELTAELSKIPKWAESLFPGLDEMCKLIAADESHTGLNIAAKAKPGGLKVTLKAADKSDILSARGGAKTQPRVSIGSNGDCIVKMNFAFQLSPEDREKVAKYAGDSDVFISCAIEQGELFS